MIEIKENSVIINDKEFEFKDNMCYLMDLDHKFCTNYAFAQGALIIIEGQIKVIDEIINRKISQMITDDNMIDLDLTNTIFMAIEGIYADMCNKNLKLFLDLLVDYKVTEEDIKKLEDNKIDLLPDMENKKLYLKKVIKNNGVN